MSIGMALLFLVPCLLARQGSGSRLIWFGGSGVFLLAFTLGSAFATFGGEQVRVAIGAYHAMTETLIGTTSWTFVGALGFMLAGFLYKQEQEVRSLLGK
jgi:hypothetical protein